MSNNIYFKKLLLIHAFAFVGFNAISQDFKWAKGAGSAEGNEVGTSVVIDAIGNSYTLYEKETINLNYQRRRYYSTWN